ncbi:MAG TPA: AMMECR1 domain-containing protein, partial [Caldisericia bacterium]|nr:AMMECR1 domain-containing protein [Caldisericia bacterium]
IVAKGFIRGLLLPDIEGVDTVEEQLRIAKLKAGINPSDNNVEIYRFKVTRLH